MTSNERAAISLSVVALLIFSMNSFKVWKSNFMENMLSVSVCWKTLFKSKNENKLSLILLTDKDTNARPWLRIWDHCCLKWDCMLEGSNCRKSVDWRWSKIVLVPGGYRAKFSLLLWRSKEKKKKCGASTSEGVRIICEPASHGCEPWKANRFKMGT